MTRRAWGEGTYDYRENTDSWRWRGYYTNANGEKQRKEITAKSRKDLRVKVKKFISEMENSGVDAMSNITVGKWCDIWLSDIIKPSVKIRTYENYRATCRNHIKPGFGNVKLKDLQVIALQRFFNSLTETHSAKTVITIRNHFSCLLNEAVKHGYIKINLVQRTKPPRKPQNFAIPLTDEEVTRLLETAEKGEYVFHDVKQRWKENDGMKYLRACYYAAIFFPVTTGMRQGEIFGLIWQNVDLENNCLRVTNTMVTSATKGELIDTPKTESSKRNILLPQKTVSVMKTWKQYQTDYQKKWHGIYENKLDLVFSNSFGKMVCLSNFNSRYFRKLLKCAGISDMVTFHSLRHTHATQLLKQGVNVKVVSERLGHSNTSVTMDIYAHALPDMQELAVKELDKIY